MIRPLGEDAEDAARWWQAYLLAENDQADELRERSAAGDEHATRQLRELAAARGGYHALRELARRLAERDMHGELRELAAAADADRRLLILHAAGEPGSAGTDVQRVRVDLGDDSARPQLARRLAREGLLDELRERAESGDNYARCWLVEATRPPPWWVRR